MLNTHSNKLKPRISSIESARYIAIIAVILLHYFPFEGNIKLFVDEIARFAVPFFFVCSGFFLAKKLQVNNSIQTIFKPIKKLFFLFLIWQIIYFMNPVKGDILQFGLVDAYLLKLNYLLHGSAEDILFCGFGFHLWFLTSLIFTTSLYFIFRKSNLKIALAFSTLAYIFGVIANSYSTTNIGITINFNTRNFIFFSALPFFIGSYIANYKNNISLSTAYVITMIGFIGHYTEAWFLRVNYGTDIMDYGFTTFLMGVGVFLISLNEPAYLKSSVLAKLGGLSTGIYCCHILIGSRIIEDFNYDFSTTFNKILLPILVIVFASALAYLLQKIKSKIIFK